MKAKLSLLIPLLTIVGLVACTAAIPASSTTTVVPASTTTTTASPVPILVDANGAVLGVPIQDGVFYNPQLKRNIAYGFGALGRFSRGTMNQDAYYFSGQNCTGTIYLKFKTADYNPAIYASLVYTWVHAFDDNYYIVTDDAVIENVQIRSQFDVLYSGCYNVDTGTALQDVYPLTAIDLPFATPLAVPFYYK